jgi:outer membrane protein assembly factor BamB
MAITIINKQRNMKLFFLLTALVWSCTKSNFNSQTKESHLGLLWSYDTESVSAPFAEPLLLDDAIFITGGLAMHKVSNSDGSRIWLSRTEGTASSLQNARIIYNEQTVVGLKPNFIVGFSKENGTIQWEIQIADSLYLYTISLGALFKTTAYYTSVQGYLFDIDINSGNLNQIYKFPFKIRNINVFENGDLLIPYEQILSEEPPYPYRAVMGRWRPSTKEWIWEYELNGGGNFSIRYPQIENNIVYSGLRGAGFIAINATTGQEIWKTIDKDLVSGFHVLTPNTIFVSALSFLYALDRHTGQLLWKSEDIGTSESTRIHYKNGYVYWGHNNGIYIYDAKTGKQVLFQSPEHGGYIWTSAMGPDRYFVQTSTHLLAYE